MTETTFAPTRAKKYLKAGRVISGLANCHVPGLYSLVFEERKAADMGMLRMFYVGRDCRSLDSLYRDGDFSLLPHNHRQDIVLYRFKGRPRNVLFSFGRQTHNLIRLCEYDFGSALLNGNFDLAFRRYRYATRRIHDIYNHGVVLPSDAVHTVIANPGDAWVVEEKWLSNEDVTQCYSMQKEKVLSPKGLYQPMSQDEIKMITKEIVRSK